MFISPMHLKDCSEAYESKDHIAELKIDGIRGVISREQDTRIYTRHKNEITYTFPEVVEAATAAIESGTTLDGELAVCDIETGKPDFAATMRRFHSKPRLQTPGLTFVAFDILSYKGKSTCSLPLMERKVILEQAMQENNIMKRMRYMEHEFIPMFDLCRAQDLEGIVIKRRSSLYYPGSRPDKVWERVVVYKREDCYITGYSKKELAWSLGILKNGKMVSVGIVKYGLTDPVRKKVFPILLKTKNKENKDFVFVEPTIQIRVRFRHWTEDGKMRLAVFEQFNNLIG